MSRLALTEFLLRRHVNAAFAASGYDCTPDEWSAICLLNEIGPCSLTALAHANGRDKTTVSRMVDRLEDKGIVKRARDHENRRKVQIALSPVGERRFQALAVIAGAKLVQALSDVDESDLNVSLRVMAQIEENLR